MENINKQLVEITEWPSELPGLTTVELANKAVEVMYSLSKNKEYNNLQKVIAALQSSRNEIISRTSLFGLALQKLGEAHMKWDVAEKCRVLQEAETLFSQSEAEFSSSLLHRSRMKRALLENMADRKCTYNIELVRLGSQYQNEQQRILFANTLLSDCLHADTYSSQIRFYEFMEYQKLIRLVRNKDLKLLLEGIGYWKAARSTLKVPEDFPQRARKLILQVNWKEAANSWKMLMEPELGEWWEESLACSVQALIESIPKDKRSREVLLKAIPIELHPELEKLNFQSDQETGQLEMRCQK